MTVARVGALQLRVLRSGSNARLAALQLRVLAVNVPPGVNVKTWTGSAFIDAPLKAWNGSAFVDAVAVKTWNGSAFV